MDVDKVERDRVQTEMALRSLMALTAWLHEHPQQYGSAIYELRKRSIVAVDQKLRGERVDAIGSAAVLDSLWQLAWESRAGMSGPLDPLGACTQSQRLEWLAALNWGIDVLLDRGNA